MSTDWIKRKRENWPTGSLERTLALSGAKSLAEAVAKSMSAPHKMPTSDNPDYVSMKKIIDELTEKLKGFDIDGMNPVTRKKLATMPLTTIKEALRWKAAWEGILNGRAEREVDRE